MKNEASKRNETITKSIFAVPARPPKHHLAQSNALGNLAIEHVRETLHSDCRKGLGIGEHLSYFESSSQASTFYTSYRNCPPLVHIHITDKQRKTQINNFSRLISWQRTPIWRTQISVSKLEKLLASVIDQSVTDFIEWSYAGCYNDSVLSHLRFWVDNILTIYVSSYLKLLKSRPQQSIIFDSTQIQQWHELSVTRLASLRTAELFDIIVDWDSTAPAVDDLKQFATNPATRSYITIEFAEVLTARLLHPGAATIEILTVYISVIRAFRHLDPRGVLLERVARRIRRYLRDREDTIQVVVAGLLAEPPDDKSARDPDVLYELARELHQHAATGNKSNDPDLDFDNMEWQPDPIDAAPDYLKSKSTDVIGSLITLFDSKDTFIKELQVVLSERLLRNTIDFDQEISVIEHLKIRFGDSALQACEVMLRDVLDSRKVDHIIRQDQAMDQMDEFSVLSDVQLHAKILSRLFWPSLQEQDFRIPLPVQHQQSLYEKGFENLKQTRKLTWLNAIGQVEVELELEDRTFHDEVLPWQASVIYAFQDETSAEQSSRSVIDLAAELEMSPALVRSACMFWSSKRILTESSRDVFTVLEVLPSGADLDNAPGASRLEADAVAAEMAAAQAARVAEDAERKEKMGLYHQFIVSMLTNQGAMPLPRIAMMLGFAVPGGFPFGNEELKEFLAGMVKDGALTVGPGGSYKIAT